MPGLMLLKCIGVCEGTGPILPWLDHWTSMTYMSLQIVPNNQQHYGHFKKVEHFTFIASMEAVINVW